MISTSQSVINEIVSRLALNPDLAVIRLVKYLVKVSKLEYNTLKQVIDSLLDIQGDLEASLE